jgi:hypothetical protein
MALGVMKVFKNSPHNLNILRDKQKYLGKRPLAPIFGAQTRWTYDTRALSRASYLFSYVKEVDVNLLKFKNIAKKHDFQNNFHIWATEGRYIIDYLLPFYKKIEFWCLQMQYSHQPTVSLVLYMLADIKKSSEDIQRIFNLNRSSNDFIPEKIQRKVIDITALFKDEIAYVFDQEFEDEKSIYEVAAFLDVRTCANHGVKVEAMEEVLLNFASKEFCKMIFPQLKDEGAVQVVVCEPLNLFNKQFSPVTNVNNVFSDELKLEIEKYIQIVTELSREILKKTATHKVEENKYYDSNNHVILDVKEHVLNKMMTLNTLEFWGKYEAMLPRLSKIAFKVLAIPASIASSERAFSAMNRIISEERSSLDKGLGADLTRFYIHHRKQIEEKRCRSTPFPTFGHTGAIEHGDYEDDVDSDYDDVDDEEDDAEDDKDDDFEPISANELDEQPVRQTQKRSVDGNPIQRSERPKKVPNKELASVWSKWNK